MNEQLQAAFEVVRTYGMMSELPPCSDIPKLLNAAHKTILRHLGEKVEQENE